MIVARKNKSGDLMITAHVMQKEGLEPSWYHYHTDLNRARLPIPPFLRTRCILQYLFQNVNTIFQII